MKKKPSSIRKRLRCGEDVREVVCIIVQYELLPQKEAHVEFVLKTSWRGQEQMARRRKGGKTTHNACAIVLASTLKGFFFAV
jgi:hypothetical protein